MGFLAIIVFICAGIFYISPIIGTFIFICYHTEKHHCLLLPKVHMMIQCLIWVVAIIVAGVAIVALIAYIFDMRRIDDKIIIACLFFIFNAPILGAIELLIYRKFTLEKFRRAQ